MEDFYSEMTSRNWAFISSDEQAAIRSTRLLMAGCGLGSVVSVIAAQTGFTDFTLVDHDVVEVSNLNRQAFDRSHVGTNKALALRSILEARSEAVSVKALDSAVTVENAAELVSNADIVLNTVDFDGVNYALNAAAREQGKPVLFPMNIAWGGFCLLFTPDSDGLEQLVAVEPPDGETEFVIGLLGSLEDFRLAPYLANRMAELPDIVGAPGRPTPQLAVAAARSASLVVEGMVRLVLGLPVRTAPRPMYVDMWDAWAE